MKAPPTFRRVLPAAALALHAPAHAHAGNLELVPLYAVTVGIAAGVVVACLPKRFTRWVLRLLLIGSGAFALWVALQAATHSGNFFEGVAAAGLLVVSAGAPAIAAFLVACVGVDKTLSKIRYVLELSRRGR